MHYYKIFGLWRLIAATLVMTYHFSHYAPNWKPVTNWFEHMAPLLDLFFIISGFLIFEHYHRMPLTRADYLEYLAKRLARLYPLHLITLSVFVAFAVTVHLGIFNSQGADTRYALSALPANLLLLQGWGVSDMLTFNFVSWSLSGEWFSYVLFPVVVFAFLRGGLGGLCLLLAFLVVALEIASALGDAGPWYDWRLLGAYRIFADFVFGAILSRVATTHVLPLKSTLWAWGAMVVLFRLMFSPIFPPAGNYYLCLALIGLSIYLAAITERASPNQASWIDPLLPATMVSFGVYLWHPVLELVFYSAIWRRLIDSESQLLFWIFMLAPSLMTLVVAMASAQYAEKPIGKWLKSALMSLVKYYVSNRTASSAPNRLQ